MPKLLSLKLELLLQNLDKKVNIAHTITQCKGLENWEGKGDWENKQQMVCASGGKQAALYL
jgi:hypothetical protein